MQGSPEYQTLEEALRNERAGSPKIRALADYAKLKHLEYLESQQPLTERMTLPERELLARKVTIEWHIEKQAYMEDAFEYMEAYEQAGEILLPYLAYVRDACNFSLLG